MTTGVFCCGIASSRVVRRTRFAQCYRVVLASHRHADQPSDTISGNAVPDLGRMQTMERCAAAQNRLRSVFTVYAWPRARLVSATELFTAKI
jgi:hypothetical protein